MTIAQLEQERAVLDVERVLHLGFGYLLEIVQQETVSSDQNVNNSVLVLNDALVARVDVLQNGQESGCVDSGQCNFLLLVFDEAAIEDRLEVVAASGQNHLVSVDQRLVVEAELNIGERGVVDRSNEVLFEVGGRDLVAWLEGVRSVARHLSQTVEFVSFREEKQLAHQVRRNLHVIGVEIVDHSQENGVFGLHFQLLDVRREARAHCKLSLQQRASREHNALVCKYGLAFYAEDDIEEGLIIDKWLEIKSKGRSGASRDGNRVLAAGGDVLNRLPLQNEHKTSSRRRKKKKIKYLEAQDLDWHKLETTIAMS